MKSFETNLFKTYTNFFQTRFPLQWFFYHIENIVFLKNKAIQQSHKE